MSNALTAIGRRFTRRTSPRTFVAAVAIALFLMPVAEALAYFAGAGSSTITGIQASSAATSVTIRASSGFTYAGPSTSSLGLGGTVSFPVNVACSPSCFITTINLTNWSSDKVGCTPAAMPGSFTMPTINVNLNIGADQAVGTAVVTWVNLASINQTPCGGAIFSFVLSTP